MQTPQSMDPLSTNGPDPRRSQSTTVDSVRDPFAELDVIGHYQTTGTIPFNMFGTSQGAPTQPPPPATSGQSSEARPSMSGMRYEPTPIPPSVPFVMPDLSMLTGGMMPGPASAPKPAVPTAKPAPAAPVEGASENLLMQVATGLSAIANAVSGGAGGAIQVGQIGHASDPKFPEWDGNEHSIHLWVTNATALKDVHHTSDKHAITYARIKLHRWIHSLYPEREEDQPKTWDEFTMWLLSNIGPADWQMMALAHLMAGNVNIKDKGMQQYVSEFLQLTRMCHLTHEPLLKAFFLRGLTPNPYVAYSILSDMDPHWTLQQLIAKARKVYTGTVHPFAMVGLAGTAPHGAYVSQLPQYQGPTVPPNPTNGPLKQASVANPSTETGRGTTGPTPMDLDVLESRIAFMIARAMESSRLGTSPAVSMYSPYAAPVRFNAIDQAQPTTMLPNAFAPPLALPAPQEPAMQNRNPREDRGRRVSQDRERDRSNSRGRSGSRGPENRGPDGRYRKSAREESNPRGRRDEPEERGRGEQRRGDRSRSSSRGRGPLICWNCQEEGHREADCPNHRRARTPTRDGGREGGEITDEVERHPSV